MTTSFTKRVSLHFLVRWYIEVTVVLIDLYCMIIIMHLQ